MIKKMSESYTVKSAIVFPQDTNSYNTIFGGKLLAYIDDVAAITARRHSRSNVVTASIDSMDFLAPIDVGEVVILESVITGTGRSSMEVMVKVSKESLTEDSSPVLTGFCFITFVALDDNGKSKPVPGIECDSEALQFLIDSANIRVERRKARLEHTKELSEYIAKDLF